MSSKKSSWAQLSSLTIISDCVLHYLAAQLLCLLTSGKHCLTCFFFHVFIFRKATLAVLKGATKSSTLLICSCRSSSRPERRSSARMSRPSSPSWETAAPSTWGKVSAGGAERPRGAGVHTANHVTLVYFQCLMPTWRWLDTRWRRASTGRHLETWKLCSWLSVRSHSWRDDRLGKTHRPRLNGFVCSLVLPQSSVPGAFQPISLRHSTMQWRYNEVCLQHNPAMDADYQLIHLLVRWPWFNDSLISTDFSWEPYNNISNSNKHFWCLNYFGIIFKLYIKMLF